MATYQIVVAFLITIVSSMCLGTSIAVEDAVTKPDSNYRLCGIRCTREYNPLCAQDKWGNTKTFSNPCLLRNAQCSEPQRKWQFVYWGECYDEVSCDFACPAIYDPVCGRNKYGDTMTFGNACEFDRYCCNYPQENWRIIGNGECGGTGTSCKCHHN